MSTLAERIAKAIEAAPVGECVVLAIPADLFVKEEVGALRDRIVRLRCALQNIRDDSSKRMWYHELARAALVEDGPE